jgi:hypothetical protein
VFDVLRLYKRDRFYFSIFSEIDNQYDIPASLSIAQSRSLLARAALRYAQYTQQLPLLSQLSFRAEVSTLPLSPPVIAQLYPWLNDVPL